MDGKVNRRNIFRKLLVDSVSDVCCFLNQTSLEDSSPAFKAHTLNCMQAGQLLHSRKTGKKGFFLRSDTEKILNAGGPADSANRPVSNCNQDQTS